MIRENIIYLSVFIYIQKKCIRKYRLFLHSSQTIGLKFDIEHPCILQNGSRTTMMTRTIDSQSSHITYGFECLNICSVCKFAQNKRDLKDNDKFTCLHKCCVKCLATSAYCKLCQGTYRKYAKKKIESYNQGT